jgi:hypothetical protein
MNIHYLILAHNNYAHLDSLIEALDAPGVDFYIHIDKTSPAYDNPKENVHLLEDRLDIIWGGFSLVEATIRLMEYAFEQSNDGYYCLLSGADYPVKSNQRIKEELAKGGEFINVSPAPLPHKPMSRFAYVHFDFKSRKLMTLAEKIITSVSKALHLKRSIPFKIYVGAQWFALSHECVGYILKEIEENLAYIDFFRYSKIPDEAFFHTIIGNSPFLERTKPNFTYIDWSTDPAPALISKKHVRKLQENQFFDSICGTYEPMFARKFDDQSKPVLEKIDRILRATE